MARNYVKAISGHIRGRTATEDKRGAYQEAIAFFDDSDREAARQAISDVRQRVPFGTVSVWALAGTVPGGVLLIGESSDVLGPGQE